MEIGTIQEEAVTRFLLHASHYLKSTFTSVTIKSPSGVTYVLLLALALLKDFTDKILIIDEHGEYKKDFMLNGVDFDEKITDSLIGFPVLTGNDFASSSFRKGRKIYFGILQKNSKYQESFTKLGNDWEISGELCNIIQQYVCQFVLHTLKSLFIASLFILYHYSLFIVHSH